MPLLIGFASIWARLWLGDQEIKRSSDQVIRSSGHQVI
jgi:hypothetical protein